MEKYDHNQVENKWRDYWEKRGWFAADAAPKPGNKKYILPQLPYPSGEGLHAGHSLVYTACDIYSRYMRMQGHDVLQVIGWDSFGLPAENFAIKTNIHPRINTDRAIGNFTAQIKGLGMSLDWNRSVGSHEPSYYKWTQWFFLLMYERGIAYRKKQFVNWCETDKTVLANEQVIDGKCERCGAVISQREMSQWFLKITDYADRLIADLDKVDWPEESKRREIEWIGRSDGAEIQFEVIDNAGKKHNITVFSTAYDTIFGATFLTLAPEYNALRDGSIDIGNLDVVKTYQTTAGFKSELERQQQQDKSGLKLEGVKAIHPLTGAELPVYIGDYVISTYGTGAVMGVPMHDERDMQFAKTMGAEIKSIVEGDGEYISYAEEIKSNLEKYTLANSAEFSGMNFKAGRVAILQKLTELKVAVPKVNYRLRDWSVSRQRFWGAPVPMVYDPEGVPHPVHADDLPVILPDDVDFLPTGQSPLTYSPTFQQGVEERYGKGWYREVDTLDTFMCSSWYYFRYLDPKNEAAFASKEALEWMPIDFYLGGTEHVNGHLLYSRFFTKVLFDAGYINFDEPFMFHRHQGTILGPDGRKMGKRFGNIISPTDIVQKYGADTMRTYLMFMGPLEQDKSWSDAAVQGVRRFLSRVYDFQQAALLAGLTEGNGELSATMHGLASKVSHDIKSLRFNTAIAEFMKVLKLFEAQSQMVSRADWIAFIKLLAPFAPFITDELWSQLGHTESIHLASWPEFDFAKSIGDVVTITIQVNGKVRGNIEVPIGAEQSTVMGEAMQLENVTRFVTGEPKKVIFVQDKIINIVT